MGRVIRSQREGAGSIFKSRPTHHDQAALFRPLDYTERQGYIRGKVTDIVHKSKQSSPLIKVVFRHPLYYSQQKSYMLAAEGIFTGQYIYAGKKATMNIGNILPVGQMPEGTIAFSVERKIGDRGCLVRASGSYAVIVGHRPESNSTRIKLPSGAKKVISSKCRAIIGQAAGGGRTEKPMLKAGNAYNKRATKRGGWPRVRGVAMNPVDHPHGGGNHQHIGHSATVGRGCPPGQKAGLIAARRSGLKRGVIVVPASRSVT
jgi:large subunit ribosomal protein L8e